MIGENLMIETETKTRKCAFIRSDGSACGAYALSDSQFCMFHEPSLELTRFEARSAGGSKNKYVAGVPVRIADVDTILDLVGEVIGNLKAMDITINQAKAILAACETAMKVLELKQLSDRVEQLEEKMLEKTR